MFVVCFGNHLDVPMLYSLREYIGVPWFDLVLLFVLSCSRECWMQDVGVSWCCEEGMGGIGISTREGGEYLLEDVFHHVQLSRRRSCEVAGVHV